MFKFKKNKEPNCLLCLDGTRHIESISGFLMKSKYSVYNLGKEDDVKYCPCCGRKNKRL